MERKERPILFSAAMVRALLLGTKTQTRRIVKPSPVYIVPFIGADNRPTGEFGLCMEYERVINRHVRCPFGQRGDRLWVRESYYQRGHWESVPSVKTKSGRMKWRFVPADDVICFDEPSEHRKGRHQKDSSTVAWHRRLARFMPRRASRITLEIVSVRAQQLHDISEDDARAEGVSLITEIAGMPHDYIGRAAEVPHTFEFERLWKSLHGTESWFANPWVWVVTFKRLEVSCG